MLELGFEIPKGIKSKWVKDIKTRMRVFNSQIFDGVYAHHNKDNAEMNRIYLEKNFTHLEQKAWDDDSINILEFDDFCEQYEANLNKLKEKELTDRKAFPKENK